MEPSAISSLCKAQRAYFETGAPCAVPARKAALAALERALKENEAMLLAALQQDLGKPAAEGYFSELALVMDEVGHAQKHLCAWARPTRCRTPLSQFPAKSFILHRPKGCVLIMSPWNYPVLLTLAPLVGALAAGCCAVVKPSAYAPAVSAALAKLLGGAFSPHHVAVVCGGRSENAALLDEAFDHIFFTGSVGVGRLVMEKAARHLCPVTLELGGKSPCIVARSADIPLAARRIAFGKFLNVGQTCVAPDYVLCAAGLEQPLAVALRGAVQGFFGPDALALPDYNRIVNEKHFRRLRGLLEGQDIAFGGRCDESTLRIEPTVLLNVPPESPVMQEEIFGPILPILTVPNVEGAIRFISARPRPLALYLFTRSKADERAVFARCHFGGGCVNDTIIHLATHEMGFGGVGQSGMGSYHGKRSFETFSHEESIVKKALWLDLPFRYRPYTKEKERIIRRVMR